MVFCGKPSGSCHACRERKTKCDKAPNGCTQCKRVKRVCPGYRSPEELMIFRDETTTVARKSKVAEAKKKKECLQFSPPVVFRVQDEAPLELVEQDGLHLSIFQLAPSVEDLAIGFFIANFVVSSPDPSRGHLEPVESFSRTGSLEDGLISSMIAVGLASLSHARLAPHLTKNARYHYVKAIQSTNAALRDPEDVKKDTTLLSIMTLGIFETITGCRQRSLKDWSEHINGAAAVIKLRGIDQIKTVPGRRMLVHVAGNLMISCIRAGLTLPKHIVEYMTAAFEYVKGPSPAFVVQNGLMHITILQAEISSKSLTSLEIITRALAIDADLLGILPILPASWEYKIEFTKEPSDFVFDNRYHIYQDFWMAEMWNFYRTVRILLHEIIRDTLLAGFYSDPPIFSSAMDTTQLQISTTTMYGMQTDILCTIPQHINQYPTGKTGSHNNSGIVRSTEPIKVLGGILLLWPLCVAGIVDTASEEMRRFVVRNLEYVGRTMGIRQAHVVSYILASRMGFKSLEED